MKSISLIILCFLVPKVWANSNIEKNDDQILVKGRVLYEESKAKKVVVNLYDQNELIQTQILESTHIINLTLDRNADYTIEITADGFFDKRVKISTMDLEPNSDPDIIKFNATLLLKSNLKSSDDFLMDFPWAVFQYDSQTNQFIIDKSYTENMLQEISFLYK